eukprot:gene2056-1244_t
MRDGGLEHRMDRGPGMRVLQQVEHHQHYPTNQYFIWIAEQTSPDNNNKKGVSFCKVRKEKESKLMQSKIFLTAAEFESLHF